MDEAQVWRLIEDAKQQSSGECDAQAARVEQALGGLPPEEIVAFDRAFDDLHKAAYRWDLWGASYLINGGASDDGFAYFRCWLIAQGREVYERALADPDSLADVIGPDLEEAECEDLWHAPAMAYEKKTGHEMVAETAGPAVESEPAGRKWVEDELDALLPRLAAKVNG
jgi:hypothetical protein